MERVEATQEEKHVTFKRAFDTYRKCIEAENFLAAYVLAFSIIEDRIRAMYVVLYRSAKHKEPDDRNRNGSLSGIIKSLCKAEMIPNHLASDLCNECERRNKLVHQAMWNLEVFDREVAEQALSLARRADNARRAQRRIIEEGRGTRVE